MIITVGIDLNLTTSWVLALSGLRNGKPEPEKEEGYIC